MNEKEKRNMTHYVIAFIYLEEVDRVKEMYSVWWITNN
jgi:hypothetical protein